MAGRAMDDAEWAAAEIVSTFYNGRLHARDVERAPDGTHDFDLVLADGAVIALEVTTAADPEVLSLDAAAFKEWSEPTLTADWWVVLSRDVVRPPMQIRALRKELAPLLATLEAGNVVEVDRRWLTPADREAFAAVSEVVGARERLVAVGVSYAKSFGGGRTVTAGHVYVSFSGGTFSDIDRVNDIVAREALANRAKLAAADASERHLFVWLNPSEQGAELAVSTGLRLQAPPALPETLDVVWLATRGIPDFGAVKVREIGVLRLWVVRPPAWWQSLSFRALVLPTKAAATAQN